MRRVVVWLLVAPCAAWVVLRVLGLERGYPLVPLVAYTPFVAAGTVVVVVVAAVLRQRGAAGAGPALRVLSVNMHYGAGSPEQLVALVRRTRADVLSVQELTPRLERALEAA